MLTILKITEDEVHKSSKLRHKFPWFDKPELVAERLAKQVRLRPEEKKLIKISKGIFRQHVLENAASYKTPPSPADCHILAFSPPCDGCNGRPQYAPVGEGV